MENKNMHKNNTYSGSIFGKPIDGKRKGEFYKANQTQGNFLWSDSYILSWRDFKKENGEKRIR